MDDGEVILDRADPRRHQTRESAENLRVAELPLSMSDVTELERVLAQFSVVGERYTAAQAWMADR